MPSAASQFTVNTDISQAKLMFVLNVTVRGHHKVTYSMRTTLLMLLLFFRGTYCVYIVCQFLVDVTLFYSHGSRRNLAAAQPFLSALQFSTESSQGPPGTLEMHL